MSKLIFTEQASTPSTPASNKVALYMASGSPARPRFIDDTAVAYDFNLTGASTASVSAGYAADTYLAGSGIVIPTTGSWRAGWQYYCMFDMTKTAAGVAAAALNLRMGTLGTTSDASVASQTYTAGTAVADTGIWECWVTFRSVGAGTAAVVQLVTKITKTLTTTGLINSTNIVLMTLTTSSGFASTTQNNIGLSFNGGASFSGTNTIVQTALRVL